VAGKHSGSPGRILRKRRDPKNIDLAVDEPPDLLLETDITTNSSDKFAIFAGIRVREIWLYNLGGFTAKALENGAHVPISASRVILEPDPVWWTSY
jgi:Uma2 family endonuclease